MKLLEVGTKRFPPFLKPSIIKWVRINENCLCGKNKREIISYINPRVL